MKNISVNLFTISLAFLLLFSLGLRLYRLDYPSKYYFDEVYHAVTAKAYAVNDPVGYEWWHTAPEPGTAYEWLHPPLGKLFMAASIVLFGPEPWAWRLPGVLFGVGIIWLTYWIGSRISGKRIVGLLAAGFVSMDGLLLAQSRIGMNDIYLTFFVLAAVGSYSFSRHNARWLWISGIMTGLAVSTKWSGVFILPMIGVWELVRWHIEGRSWLKRIPLLMLVYVFLPAVIYVSSYGQFWLQGHSVDQFQELHRQIWWYQTNLDATHSYQSQAWEWPLMLRPVWYFVDYLAEDRVAHIYNLGNPLLMWFGLMAQIVLGLSLLGRHKRNTLRPELFWVTAYIMSWMPWLVSPRIMFFYHYAPAIPFLALALATVCSESLQFRYGKWIVGSIVGLITIGFLWFLPIWVGVPLDPSEVDMRLLLPSWK